MTATIETVKTRAETDARAVARTYRMLAARPGAPVRIGKIWEMFDWSVARCHAAVLRLLDTAEPGTVLIEATMKRRDLTEWDHMVALLLGGEWKHEISIIG